MTQLRIDEITPSKSGKAWRIKSGSTWYGANKDEFSLSCKGLTYDVNVSTGDFGPWVKLMDHLPQKGAPSAPTQAPAVSKGPLPSGLAPFWLPFASNVCAHAISAGLIKEPSQLKQWVLAAGEAAESAAEGDVNY